jgi:hypothetical protein
VVRFVEDFLHELKAGPAGGRLRRPSSAGRPAPVPLHLLGSPAHRNQEMKLTLAATTRRSVDGKTDPGGHRLC